MASCRSSPVVQQTLDLNYMSHKKDASFKWSLVNGCLLSIILYDLSFKCPSYTTCFNYFEYLLVVILGSNTLYHTVRYLYLMCTIAPVVVTPKQKELLGFKDADSSFKLKSEAVDILQPQADLDISMPFSMSSRSWMTSNSSPNTSRNSVTSSSWMFQRGSPAGDVSPGPRFPSNFATCEESIADEHTLHEYLRKYEEKQSLVHNSSADSSPKDLSSFWRHPSSRSPNEVSPGFRRTLYQLAPLNSAQQVTKGSSEEGSPSSLQHSPQLSWSLQHDAHHLTQWNLNLRLWISRTILDRVVKEINNIDENLQKHGLPDVKIGFVGLERLKKTAQTSYVMQHIPTLPTLVPFLEISNNQEYLDQRIKELSKGGCMSEFKWKAGGSLHDKSWDDTLPTDSAIIMHFFATYLDTQLLPVNQNPDSRPFTSQHFCKAPEKPQRSASALIIHQLAVHPPHFVLIDGENTIEVAKGRNNLIHTVLLFLHTVATKHHGMLGRVNLGKSGVNVLWVIDR